MKNQYRGGIAQKGEAWTVCRFKGGLGKKERVVFLSGDDTPMHTLSRRTEKCVPHKQNMRKYTMIVLSISKISWN